MGRDAGGSARLQSPERLRLFRLFAHSETFIVWRASRPRRCASISTSVCSTASQPMPTPSSSTGPSQAFPSLGRHAVPDRVQFGGRARTATAALSERRRCNNRSHASIRRWWITQPGWSADSDATLVLDYTERGEYEWAKRS